MGLPSLLIIFYYQLKVFYSFDSCLMFTNQWSLKVKICQVILAIGRKNETKKSVFVRARRIAAKLNFFCEFICCQLNNTFVRPSLSLPI